MDDATPQTSTHHGTLEFGLPVRDATVSATYQQIAGSFRIRVTARLFAFRGLVREAYGDAAIPQATVTILDGPDAGRTASTDSSGAFSFTDIAAPTVRITTTMCCQAVDARGMHSWSIPANRAVSF